MLKKLVEMGIVVNVPNSAGETALTNATLNRCIECANYSSENGADPDIISNSNAAIHFATMFDAHEVLHELLVRGVNCSAKNTQGETILHLRALAHTATISILIGHGINGIEL